MSLNATYVVVSIGGIIVGALLGGLGAWRGWWESPRRREEREQAAATAIRSAAMADAILGEPEVTDLAGSIITPKRPGLVARTATLELAVATLVDQQAQLNALTGRVDVVESTVSGLIASDWKSGADAVLKAAVLKTKGVIDVESEG